MKLTFNESQFKPGNFLSTYLRIGLFSVTILSQITLQTSAQNPMDPFKTFNWPGLLNEKLWSSHFGASIEVGEFQDRDCLYLKGPGVLSVGLPVEKFWKRPFFVSLLPQSVAGEALKEGTVIDICGAKLGFRIYHDSRLTRDNGLRSAEILVYNSFAEDGKSGSLSV